MRRNELSDLATQIRARRSHHVTFGAAAVGDQRVGAKMRCDAGKDVRHLRHRSSKQNNVGIAHFARHIAADAVEYAELPGFFQRCCAASETNHFAYRPRLAQGQRERPAYQSNAENDDFRKGGLHVLQRPPDSPGNRTQRTHQLLQLTRCQRLIGIAPSLGGFGCISTSRPSAPAAMAACDNAGTIHALPPACEGSTITGRWVSFFSTAMAVTSSTLR